MFKSSFAFVLFVTGLLPSTLAHGFVRILTIDGKQYTGPTPGTSPGSSVIRVITNTNPNHLSDAGADLACGKAAATKGAQSMAQAKPGSTLTWTWDAGDGTPWPHDIGPMITYAADCGDHCSTFDASKGQWFKIDQVGKTKTPGNDWVQGQIHQGKDYSMKLPENFPNGNWLIRHEIIALHLADKMNGAEFYPSCSQVTVSGGSSSAAGSPTVTFPRAYNQNDPGIFINVWDKTGVYPFPGPALASFGGPASSNSTPSSSNATTSAVSATASNSTDIAIDDAVVGSSSMDDSDCEDGSDDESGSEECDSGNETDDDDAGSSDDGPSDAEGCSSDDETGDTASDDNEECSDDDSAGDGAISTNSTTTSTPNGDSGDGSDDGDDSGDDSTITSSTPSATATHTGGGGHHTHTGSGKGRHETWTKTRAKPSAPTSPARIRRSRAHHRRAGHRM